jgi:hypothetical protein
MASLTNTKIKDTYDGLLKTTDNNALGGTYKLITDGLGNSSGVYLGTGGNVGIGESVPTKPLTINKNQSETAILVQSSDTGTAGIYIGGQSDSIKGGLILDNSDDSLQLRGYNNANRLHIDSSGNVGIGTNNPQSKIQVEHSDFARLDLNLSNSSGTTIADVRGLVSGTEKWRIGKTGSSSDDFTINVTGSERMRIDLSGNVGIGTTDPTKLLHIASQSAQSVITLQRTNTNTSGAIGALQWTALDNHTVASMVALGDGNDEGAHITFNTTSAASSDNPFGISERLRITSSGNVGIGETSPDRQLHLKSSLPAIRLEDSDVSGLYHEFFASTAGFFQFKADGGNVQSGSGFLFQVDNSEKMRINSDGNVLIGTSSNRPDEINDNGIAIHNSGKQYQFSTSDFAVLKSSSTGTKIFFRYGTSGSQNTQIGSISYPTTSSVAYNTTSDYRLKENVVDMTGALDRVEQLQPKRFNFIQDPEITFDGFLAHEVQSVIPEAITGEKDAVDDEGNPEYQGIDQSKIVPLLVGAIKELKAEIETLKSQINS